MQFNENDFFSIQASFVEYLMDNLHRYSIVFVIIFVIYVFRFDFCSCVGFLCFVASNNAFPHFFSVEIVRNVGFCVINYSADGQLIMQVFRRVALYLCQWPRGLVFVDVIGAKFIFGRLVLKVHYEVNSKNIWALNSMHS